MKTIRERFEEIWPAPEGVFWRDSKGRYGCDSVSDVDAMDAHNIRLDTFTRCQETTAIHLSLIDSMIKDLEYICQRDDDGYLANQIAYAKQIMEQKK